MMCAAVRIIVSGCSSARPTADAFDSTGRPIRQLSSRVYNILHGKRYSRSTQLSTLLLWDVKMSTSQITAMLYGREGNRKPGGQ